MDRFTISGASLVLAVGLLVGACGKNKEVPAGKNPQLSTDDQKVQEVAKDLDRVVVKRLTFSFATEKALRAAGKNPSSYAAHLVEYRSKAKNTVHELVEVSLNKSGVEVGSLPAFLHLDIAMNTEGEHSVNELFTTISPTFGIRGPKYTRVGGYIPNGRDVVDLCAGEYADACLFDAVSKDEELNLILRGIY